MRPGPPLVGETAVHVGPGVARMSYLITFRWPRIHDPAQPGGIGGDYRGVRTGWPNDQPARHGFGKSLGGVADMTNDRVLHQVTLDSIGAVYRIITWNGRFIVEAAPLHDDGSIDESEF